MTATQRKPTKLGDIKGLITQIKTLAEAGGLNAVSMTENGKSKPVSRTGLFKSINTIAALAEIETRELAENIEQAKTLLEIAINQGGQVTDKDGKPLSAEEVLELVFNALTEAETHLNTLIHIEAEGNQ
ncbi:hypothetical protein ACLQ90_02225 [Avibacterium paragallinarum]|uniref:Uncharacterized protein n=1 Tax=Avibacterium paragallinarum TaxID=728 RepID=A0AAE5TIT3_AVIPA|nr:hypothetical protein [Avibacterium paragallinarum]MEE3607709.1 hypothetical protein [Avibacterium paragallinarum]MEE3620405.1 hypothetical protein [Avibacterium paragallinarum]MEE3668426.1 hypothetical protein [Avibacterium paragallinarum]MEE3680782.1 hypothetical protein [Avibacterium paragallinarum]MEE4385529.1 hypothetical protein [Avibacterium paragallinarum]